MGLLKAISSAGDARGRPVKADQEGMLTTEVQGIEARRSSTIKEFLPGKQLFWSRVHLFGCFERDRQEQRLAVTDTVSEQAGGAPPVEGARNWTPSSVSICLSVRLSVWLSGCLAVWLYLSRDN